MNKINKNKYPLRKVTERRIVISGGEKNQDGFYTPYVFGNRLECGHVVRPVQDFYGEIHSQRQRCRYCYEEQNNN